MAKKLNKAIDELLLAIKENDSYKKCVVLKEKLDKSEDVKVLVEEIKKLQKEFVRTGNEQIRKELDKREKSLEEIPIYNLYMKNLEQVNSMIEMLKNELNNYFDNLLNR